jgi:glutamate dehydrogenase
VPRARFTSALPELVASMASTQYGGEVRDLETLLGTSSLARISMTVRARHAVDLEGLAEAVDAASMTWEERSREALIDAAGELEGHRLFELVRRGVPFDYQARVRPSAAVGDLINVAALLDASTRDDAATQIVTSFGRSIDADEDRWRFRVFLRGRSATIAELVPMLEHLGLSAIDEHPYQFGDPSAPVYLYDIGVTLPAAQIGEAQHRELQTAFVGLMNGTIEADGLNRLVLLAGLDTRQVAVLRLYNRYLRQTGFPFTPAYVEQALVRHSAIARLLAQLFDLRFDPRLDRIELADGTSSVDGRLDEIRAALAERLEAVPSLDDDRICRAFLTLIEATVRTTAFTGGDEIAVKLAPHAIPFLPEPRPVFEIFVCSPLVEGVHLRGGRIARGGLRWSDRPEDFRTEVLGLVKAQMVKNAVIVPVGAKGGFVVKRATADPADRDAVRIEGIDRYRRFVGALLELTDNIVGSDVVHPAGIVIHDADDTYLVVAADKGTATFSDIANEISIERGFWLGDAFASGGSHGYDHKAMGITARGAWESVRRHARVIDKDLETDELTVVGVGDMSGDVFGNGMLLSAHLKLVAAFDHRHIFIDPDPDPERSHAERRRLFDLPRSSWADYDTSFISPGGGVHSRSAKSIALTGELRAAIGLDDESVTTSMRPDELIAAILRAPVDLLWNGGIGTYVKASTESHEAVGDRANDAVRVDADTLRCRIVGEGGNLGLTQLARVEYAINGGLIFADAIDNSAGVDCSDHEVNIKIVLDRLVRDGDVTTKQRNELLAEMTDDVAELVLDDNRAQTLALMIARRQSLPMVNVHARYLDTLEAEGYLDRALEFLPTDKQIAERQSAGAGLCAPEFAVLIAYTKNADEHEILTTDLPDQDALRHELADYFPAALRERYAAAIERHPLRREIITTRVVNDMVNLAGISFDHRMTEDSGASVSDVTRSFLASRDVFGFRAVWAEVDGLGASVDLDTQIDLLLDVRRMAERGTVWLLRHRHPPLDIAREFERFQPGISELANSLDDVVSGRVAAAIEAAREKRIDAGVPPDLAARAARWPWLHTGFDIVELAANESSTVLETAAAYWTVFEAFDLGWLWDGVGALPRSDRWQSQARGALRDDLMTVLADLTRSVMRVAGGSPAAWIGANERAVGRTIAMHTEIRRAESFDLTTLSVALRQLRNLTMTAVAAS